jgi:hypothetical protein
MGAELAIDIDVQISDELRELMRLRRGAPKPAPAPARTRPLPEWQTLALRQDGARPLVFRGLPLFEIRHSVGDLPGQAELGLALYLSEGEGLLVSLTVLPPETLAARPIHRAAHLTDGDAFARLLRDFAPETCLETGLVTDEDGRALHASARRAIRAAFTSMAADCLTKGILPA